VGDTVQLSAKGINILNMLGYMRTDGEIKGFVSERHSTCIGYDEVLAKGQRGRFPRPFGVIREEPIN
jgi:hypothetical protein